MNRFFLSDVHLFPEPQQHPGRDRFLSFLKYLKDSFSPGELWILGDLFDFWFEYSSVLPSGYDRCINALRILSDSGWSVNFLPGNHDFWVGEGFAHASGVTIHFDNPHTIEAGGKTIILTHGDGLGPGDLGYKILKPVLRSPVSRFLFRLLHPDAGAAFARFFSDTSKRILRKDLDHIPAGLEIWMKRMLVENADYVITGHTHLDSIIELKEGTCIALGDWLTRFTYCVIRDDNTEPELLSYSCESMDR
jgi:UDP-2,3-diacylglucosamine hydrolase